MANEFKHIAAERTALASVALVLLFTAYQSAWAGHALPQPLAPQSQSHTAPMTNADILSLTAAGIDADIIVTKIRSAPSKAFDTSVDALKSLKSAGVANDVLLNMVNGGVVLTPGIPTAGSGVGGASDFKEPVLKEGLWEEHTTTSRGATDLPTDDTELRCHSHAHDHAEFQRLRSGGSGQSSHDLSSRGVRVSVDDDVKCAVSAAASDSEKQTIEERCQTHGIAMTMKMHWTLVDEDHMRSEATMTYNPPVAGMSALNTLTELTFKGPCPAGVNPGDTVDDAAPEYKKRPKKGH